MNTYLQQQFGLENKVAVITGASRGLGQAMAIALGEAGATVVAIGSKVENVANTISLLKEKGVSCLALGCDQGDGEQISQAINIEKTERPEKEHNGSHKYTQQ